MMNIYVHRDSKGHPVSTHELNPLYPALKKDARFLQGWSTRLFLDALMGLPDSNKFFKICNWQEHIPIANQGYYLLHYGNPQAIINNIGFITLPATVRDQINDGSLHLLIVYVYETFDNTYSISEWQDKFCSFLTELGIHRRQSVKVLLSGHSELMHEHGDSRVSWIFYPWLEAAMQADAYKKYRTPDNVPVRIQTSPKQYKFLNLNRAPRNHRILMLAMLELLNVSQYGYISWPQSDPQLTRIPTQFDCYSMGIKRNPRFEKFLLTNTRLSEHYANSQVDVTDPWTSAVSLYHQAEFEIINETHHCNIGDVVFLTEKTFRSLMVGIPFILNGNPGSLKLLHKLGYRTFDTVFDESYDSIYSPMHAIEHIANQVHKICILDQEAPNPFHQSEIAEVIEHNQQNFWSKNHANNIYNSISNS